MKRSSGILLPVFSLPSPYGIGTLGREAYNFIDFLAAAGQKHWQMLPLGPTGFGDSPYQSFSSYAGNPYFIDLNLLIENGLMLKNEVEEISWGDDPGRVDYEILYRYREPLLKKAFRRFFEGSQPGAGEKTTLKDDFSQFCRDNLSWLDDYALFMALKGHFDMAPWHEWHDEDIRRYLPEAAEKYKLLLSEEIKYHRFVQYLFFSQWGRLREYGKEHGIKFIGDLPIYVSMDSADSWTSKGKLQFDENAVPLGVSGVPPDYFSETGQLWGNPLYNWEEMRKDGYTWWMRRIAAAAGMFDCIRLDHFRGFDSYWRIPFGNDTAVEGEWLAGPGIDFISRVKEQFPNLEVIAEDLGNLTESVHKLLAESGFPGMKVLLFAFSQGDSSEHLPPNYNSNSVVYTGTHDNTTVRGWIEKEASIEELSFAEKYFESCPKNGWNWRFICTAMESVADLCIVQLQDYLSLPDHARINTPGTLGGNWQWRLIGGELKDELAKKIAEMSGFYGR
ncbi:4-alpha-glucanotransferase [Bacillota bacterium]